MAVPDEHTIKLFIDGATAVGTVAVAILAIWGDKIRAYLAPAKLVIEPVEAEIRGHVAHLSSPPNVATPGGTQRAMWYALKVVNKRPWRSSRNCRVLLKAISRRGPDGVYRPEPFTVPRQFWWAPSESTPSEINLGKEHAFDFGYLGEQPEARFTPTLYSIPNNFSGFVNINDSVRYSLEIDADNFSSRKYQVFEVSWDGMWYEDSENMARHLTIREIGIDPVAP